MVYEGHEKPRLCEKTTEVIVYVHIGNIASESVFAWLQCGLKGIVN
jgi:hypothetical protein